LRTKNRGWLALLALLIAALALAVAGCGGDDDDEEAGGGDTAAATDGGDTGEGGGGGTTVKIVSDLPLQGSSREQTETIVNAIELYLEQNDSTFGDYTIEYESFDDATAAKGAWDEAVCAANARKYVEDETILGVVGTFNSGCAKIIVPILNEASVAMVSPANTAVGLTHKGVGAEAGEPDKYFPTGTRNYTRVVASDDYQGKIGAQIMKDDLGVTKVFILDDKDAYGKGVADAFEFYAKEVGLEVAGHEGWDAQAQNYQSLMTKIKASGADGIYIGGIADFNGGQLIKDKVAVVGSNEDVKVLASDGFVLQSLFEEAGQANAEGVYGTAPVLNPEDLGEGGTAFLEAYEAEHGKPEVYTAYGVAAAQALIAAIEASDGTREDVVAKLFEVSIPADEGIVGAMSFDENGDPTEGLISLFKGTGGTWAFEKAVPLS
jgi:branched-chain amino acid transport system substrate-binding protein